MALPNPLIVLLFSALTLSSCASRFGEPRRNVAAEVEGDGPQFLQQFKPQAMICEGTRVRGDTALKDLGRIKVEVLDQTTETPSVEVQSEDKSTHFFIGNEFAGSLKKSGSCRYYSTKDRIFYVCYLDDPTKPINFLDVRNASKRSSFSADLACDSAPSCVKLKNCEKADQ